MNAADIREKIIQAVQKLNEKNPYYTIAGFLVIVFLLDYFLIMHFQLRTLNSLGLKVKTVRGDVIKSKEDIQRFAAYQNQLKRLQERYQKIDSRVRSKDEMSLVLENISRVANNNGVRMEKMLPNTALIKPVLKNNDGQYSAIPIQVEARSNYHDFGRFLNQLENEEIFLKIPEFVIRTATSGDQTRHEIELTIQAIVFEKNEKKGK